MGEILAWVGGLIIGVMLVCSSDSITVVKGNPNDGLYVEHDNVVYELRKIDKD